MERNITTAVLTSKKAKDHLESIRGKYKQMITDLNNHMSIVSQYGKEKEQKQLQDDMNQMDNDIKQEELDIKRLSLNS